MSEYIDRDAFLKHLQKDPLFNLIEQYGITGVIESFSTSDVQPVKHGRWETEICDDGYGAYNLFVCSLCGSESAKRFNYCRNCGAKMDGET